MLARSDSTLATSRLGRLRANPEVARAAMATAEERMRTIFVCGELSEKNRARVNWLEGWVEWAELTDHFIPFRTRSIENEV